MQVLALIVLYPDFQTRHLQIPISFQLIFGTGLLNQIIKDEAIFLDRYQQ